MITVDAAVLGDPRALLVDHAELAPERAGVDRDGLPAIAGSASGARKTLTMSTGTGHVEQARVARLAEDLGLAGIDRDHPVAVALEVVADEVARAQLVARTARRSRSCCALWSTRWIVSGSW